MKKAWKQNVYTPKPYDTDDGSSLVKAAAEASRLIASETSCR